RVILPTRNRSFGLSRTIKLTIPLPVPLPLTISIQLAPDVAVQFTPAGAETFSKASSPAAVKALLLGENVVRAISAAAFAFRRPWPNTLLGEPLLLHRFDEM